MSQRTPAQLPAATLQPGDRIRRAGKWRDVERIGAGVGLFDGLLEISTTGPYVRPWPVEVDRRVTVLVDENDARVAC